MIQFVELIVYFKSSSAFFAGISSSIRNYFFYPKDFFCLRYNKKQVLRIFFEVS